MRRLRGNRRDTVGRVPGAIGAAVVAVSPFSLYYGVEARPYATLAFCCALSTYALVRAARTREVRWWGLYAVAAAAAPVARLRVEGSDAWPDDREGVERVPS